MQQFEDLTLKNQLCFPLYVCSKEIIKKYKPFLDQIDLTYTQYITMMVLWEKKEINVKELGNYLFLDSGTLTPLLKKLENKEYIKRKRSNIDERNLIVSITEKGIALQKQASKIPKKIKECLDIKTADINQLYKILYQILDKIKE